MQLTEAQTKSIRQWVAEGLGLSDIQKKLSAEYQLSLPFIDVRFLLIDLGLELKETSKPRAAPADLSAPKENAPEPMDEIEEETLAAPQQPPPGAGVSIEVDRICRPGFIVSGTVTFSDGVTAKWALDQMGRLALDAGKPGYRPSQQDIQSFQMILSRKLQNHAM